MFECPNESIFFNLNLRKLQTNPRVDPIFFISVDEVLNAIRFVDLKWINSEVMSPTFFF